MKKENKYNNIGLFILLLPLAIILITVSGCSSRLETGVTNSDSTTVYPAKNEKDIEVNIELCRKINKKTGEPFGSGTVFTSSEKARIHAIIEIENRFYYDDKELMFHVNWIKPNGKSLYKKRIDLLPEDTSTSIKSSINISNESQREPGEYTIEVYLFRELIAEKKFELLPELIISPSLVKEIAPKITLYRKISKKTGKRIGEGDVFKMKKKRKVRALVEFGNRYAVGKYDLKFRLSWIGPEGDTVYSKSYDLYPNDTTSRIKSSISISSDKRQPGIYNLQLILFNEMIAEKKFELRQ